MRPRRCGSGSITLDTGLRRAKVGEESVTLTDAEFRILELLVRSAGRVVTRSEITRRALGRKRMGLDRSVDTHVSNLRRKLGASIEDIHADPRCARRRIHDRARRSAGPRPYERRAARCPSPSLRALLHNFFTRIFLSFWAVMVLITASAAAVTAIDFAATPDRPSTVIRAAQEALDRDGVEGLKVWLAERNRSRPKQRTLIIDPHGAGDPRAEVARQAAWLRAAARFADSGRGPFEPRGEGCRW